MIFNVPSIPCFFFSSRRQTEWKAAWLEINLNSLLLNARRVLSFTYFFLLFSITESDESTYCAGLLCEMKIWVGTLHAGEMLFKCRQRFPIIANCSSSAIFPQWHGERRLHWLGKQQGKAYQAAATTVRPNFKGALQQCGKVVELCTWQGKCDFWRCFVCIQIPRGWTLHDLTLQTRKFNREIKYGLQSTTCQTIAWENLEKIVRIVVVNSTMPTMGKEVHDFINIFNPRTRK